MNTIMPAAFFGGVDKELSEDLAFLCARGPRLVGIKWTPKELAAAVAGLSEALTKARGATFGSPYLDDPLTLAAYAAYFVPWNVLKMTRLMRGLPLSLPEYGRVLDVGAGPLTATIALWMSRPAWRQMPVEVVAVDQSEPSLKLGVALFEELCDHHGVAPWRVNYLPMDVDPALDELAHSQGYDLIVAGSALSEFTLSRPRTALPHIKRQIAATSRLLLNEGQLLYVEPGTRIGGRTISMARQALLERKMGVIAPCTHDQHCPMPGKPHGSWCHFLMRTAGAPANLIKLSEEAELPKATMSASFLLAHKGPAAEAGPELDGKIATRVISGSFPLPNQGERALGQYGCSELGQILLVHPGGRPLTPGDLTGLDQADLDESERDRKSQALLVQVPDDASRPSGIRELGHSDDDQPMGGRDRPRPGKPGAPRGREGRGPREGSAAGGKGRVGAGQPRPKGDKPAFKASGTRSADKAGAQSKVAPGEKRSWKEKSELIVTYGRSSRGQASDYERFGSGGRPRFDRPDGKPAAPRAKRPVHYNSEDQRPKLEKLGPGAAAASGAANAEERGYSQGFGPARTQRPRLERPDFQRPSAPRGGSEKWGGQDRFEGEGERPRADRFGPGDSAGAGRNERMGGQGFAPVRPPRPRFDRPDFQRPSAPRGAGGHFGGQDRFEGAGERPKLEKLGPGASAGASREDRRDEQGFAPASPQRPRLERPDFQRPSAPRGGSEKWGGQDRFEGEGERPTLERLGPGRSAGAGGDSRGFAPARPPRPRLERPDFQRPAAPRGAGERFGGPDRFERSGERPKLERFGPGAQGGDSDGEAFGSKGWPPARPQRPRFENKGPRPSAPRAGGERWGGPDRGAASGERPNLEKLGPGAGGELGAYEQEDAKAWNPDAGKRASAPRSDFQPRGGQSGDDRFGGRDRAQSRMQRPRLEKPGFKSAGGPRGGAPWGGQNRVQSTERPKLEKLGPGAQGGEQPRGPAGSARPERGRPSEFSRQEPRGGTGGPFNRMHRGESRQESDQDNPSGRGQKSRTDDE